MGKYRLASRAFHCRMAVLLAFGLLIPGLHAQESPVSTKDLLELGDGSDPLAPGVGDVLGVPQPGPDWNDLFNASRVPRDEFDEAGASGANGVPDFLDTYGVFRSRRDLVFIRDDISAGSDIDDTALDGSGAVVPAQVESKHDLGNAYAYAAFDSEYDLILYTGVERLVAAGPSNVVFEFNQLPFSLEPGGQVVGDRSIGDVRIRLDFDAGQLSSVEVWGWEYDSGTGNLGYILLSTLSSEGCNAQGSACVSCNDLTISGGEWPSYDSSGNTVSSLQPFTFFEVGLNLGQLFQADMMDVRYSSLMITTPQDFALKMFRRASYWY